MWCSKLICSLKPFEINRGVKNVSYVLDSVIERVICPGQGDQYIIVNTEIHVEL